MHSLEDFKTEVLAQIGRAEKQGRPHAEINAGELHRTMGGYPEAGHQMPSACSAMKQLMTAADTIVYEPQGGAGASLTIRYVLPR